MKHKILIATSNPGKIAEIKAMLDFDVDWVSLSDFAGIGQIKEDGSTFAENARKKAAGYAKATGLWTIADDSGLVIDVLSGAPGVKSARFSGEKPIVNGLGHPLREIPDGNGEDSPRPAVKPQAKYLAPRFTWGLIDHKNIAKVLKLLEGVPKEKRTARFVCHLCLASPEKIMAETEGTLQGIITDKEIGTNGFGYDPIFFVPHLNKTVAQLSADEKNAISHRGNAIRKLKPLLRELLKRT